MPSSVSSQVTAIGEVQGPRLGPKPNRNLREKRRLTQFNFEAPSPCIDLNVNIDLLEVVKTLANESRSRSQRRGSTPVHSSTRDACESDQHPNTDDEDYDGGMTTTSDEEEDEDSCSEIGAEDIILKWVV